MSINSTPKLSIGCAVPPPAGIPLNPPGIRLGSIDGLIGVSDTVTDPAGAPPACGIRLLAGIVIRAVELGTKTVSPVATDTVAVVPIGTSLTPRLAVCPDVTRATGKASANPFAATRTIVRSPAGAETLNFPSAAVVAVPVFVLTVAPLTGVLFASETTCPTTVPAVGVVGAGVLPFEPPSPQPTSSPTIRQAASKPNEAPRSKLRGITELNSEDFSEGEANPVASYGECQVQC